MFKYTIGKLKRNTNGEDFAHRRAKHFAFSSSGSA